MLFKFHDKKTNTSDTLREYAKKKIGKLEKYFKEEPQAQIAFFLEGGLYGVEVTVHTEGMIVRARETTSDMYASIDNANAAIERQIHKHKTRLSKRLHQNAFEREVPSTLSEPDVDEERDFPIIRTKRFNIKPMSCDEAILQMNLLDHQFYVFRNVDNQNSFAVAYRRNDGGYGLIEGE